MLVVPSVTIPFSPEAIVDSFLIKWPWLKYSIVGLDKFMQSHLIFVGLLDHSTPQAMVVFVFLIKPKFALVTMA